MYFHINKILIFGFIIRVLIAIWNSFMGPSFGAEGDAFSFHLEAIEYSNNPKLEEFIIGWFYSFILGYIYYLITPTLFLGCILSCLTWLISTIYLIKIMELLNYNTSIQNKVVIIYAFLPSSILYTSVTLREVYQLLFINLSVYGVLKIIINMQFRYWILLFFSVAGMGVLHGALFAFGFILIISILFIISFRGRRSFIFFKFIILITLMMVIIIISSNLFEKIAYKIDGGLINAILNYQEGSLSTEARAHYKNDVNIEINTNFNFIKFILIGFIQYQFEPFPWKISSLLDLVALIENILRGWLLWNSMLILKFIKRKEYRKNVLVLYCYLLIELIWSMGTVNWGTAMRHHLPSFGLLIITSYAIKNNKIMYSKN